MNYLWTSDELVSAMHGRPYGSLPAGVTGISIDSRSIGKGEAFFAIKGDRVDGHDYASVAAANGAALLVVSEAKLPALGRVYDSNDRGGRCAGRAGAPGPCRARFVPLPRLLRDRIGRQDDDQGNAAQGAGIVGHGSCVGRIVTQSLGVPLTLARMAKDVDYGVFEIGMNHPGEIRALFDVRPDISIITTVAGAHLGNFRSVEEIAYAKSEILEGIEADGHAILNRDIEYFPILEKVAIENRVPHIHSFGNNARADFRLAEFNGHATVRISGRSSADGRSR